VATLLDSESPFEAVYSLHRHDVLGYLVGAYVVHAPEGKLGMKYNRLLPENLSRYGHRLDDTDRKLVTLLDEIVLQNLFKKFKKKESSLQQFVDKFAENPHRQYILQYIERRVAQVPELLQGKPLYVMSKDGYPAARRLWVDPTPAEVRLRIVRDESGLEYEAIVSQNGNRLPLEAKPGGVVGIKPVWLWHDDRLLPIPDLPDGRRLKPFFNKPVIKVPKTSEADYFQKFIRKLVAEMEIEAQGFEVTTVEETPRFTLDIVGDNAGIVTLKARVWYGPFELPIDAREKFRVKAESAHDDYTVHRIRRNREAEAEFTAFFEALRTDGVSLIDFSLPEAKAHEWIADNLAKLRAQGVEVRQQLGNEEFTYAQPTLLYTLEALPPSALLLRCHLGVEGQQVPLERIRPNILKGEGKVQLPDGRWVYIPQAWLDDLRHLMEVARPAEGGLRLVRYQLGIVRSAFRGKTAGEPPPDTAGLQDIAPQPVPPQVQATLRDYQKAGYDWLWFLRQNGLGGILADDMGLGKTLQALTLLQRVYAEGADAPTLVVLPNSLVYNWLSEAEKFTPELKVLVYKGGKRAETVPQFFAHHLILTTYGTMRQDAEALAQVEFEYVILDESHFIKNREAKTTRAVLDLRARNRLSITGTPIENSTMDLWTQFEFLNPGLLGTAAFFDRHYALQIERGGNDERAQQLHDVVNPFILRRTKEMVAKDLPDRIEQVQPCEMAPKQLSLYTRTSVLYRRTLFADRDEAALARNRLQVLSSLQRLRQIAIHPQLVDPLVTESGKYEVMLDLLAEVLAAGNKVLIFSQFVKLLRIIEPDLRARGIPFAYLDGSQRPEERAQQVERFQTDPAVPVFLISLKAGGVGLNLTAAQYVFLLDPWWNPAVEQQAINRAHRIGQQQTVFVYKFITKDTIEEKILKLQERKLQLAREVVRSEAQFFKALTKADLEALFE
jgi:superfamily II DNA or RNA helicase